MVSVETKTTDGEGQAIGPITVEFELGDTLAATVDLFTEAVVYSNATAQIKITLQNYIRGLMRQGKNAKEIQKIVSDWKPGMRTPGKSKGEKIKTLLEGLSDEDRKAVLAEVAA